MGERRGPLPRPIGAALQPLYRWAITGRNRRFDSGRGVVRLDLPTISVGNLSVGGTGKTPMVHHLVRLLLEAGHRPCIAMRGYRGAAGGSDEAAAYRREFPDVPVVAQANRTDGLLALFNAEHVADGDQRDCIVLDDGFQHRQIARDLDIVLIDASRDPFGDRLLPLGWLREPIDSLKRAGFVMITHAESAPGGVAAMDENLRAVLGRIADAVTRHTWSGLDVHERGASSMRGVSWLRGKRLAAVCAIGNPAPFLAGAERASGGALAGRVVVRDHDAYSDATLRRVFAAAQGADAVVTTGKDWSKLSRVRPELWPCPVAVARLEMGFDRGGAALADAVLETVARGAPEDA